MKFTKDFSLSYLRVIRLELWVRAVSFSFFRKKKDWNHIKSFFLEPYEEKTSYTVPGGVLFIYIYPNEPSIESLQLMFDPEEKEKIFEKWAFMIQWRIKLI